MKRFHIIEEFYNHYLEQSWNGIGTFIEISEKVETLECNKDSEEITYQIYKELREEGIIWGDPKPQNIGILLNDNVVKLNGKIMDVSNNAVGFIDNDEKVTLKKGDYVIIDTDFLYKESDAKQDATPDEDKYKKRYEREKKEENRNKIAFFHDQKSETYFLDKSNGKAFTVSKENEDFER